MFYVCNKEKKNNVEQKNQRNEEGKLVVLLTKSEERTGDTVQKNFKENFLL